MLVIKNEKSEGAKNLCMTVSTEVGENSRKNTDFEVKQSIMQIMGSLFTGSVISGNLFSLLEHQFPHL